jgi:PAS domain S-box-containing protein
MGHERLLEITKGLSFLELPIGVYVVTFDGRLVEANIKAREILGLPLDGQIEDSILRFYKDPSARNGLPDKLRASEEQGQYLVSQLTFVVNGKEIYVQDHARTIKDPVTQEELGFLCCMMDITSEVRYRKMFNDLPVGVYGLDSQDKIERVNEAFAELFGYDTPEELIGKQIQEFYVDPEEAQEFRESLEREGELRDYVVQVRKQNRERIYVRVSATKLTSAEGKYIGREGTVMEADKERYKRILEVAPIGLFEVQSQDGEDRIVHCNDQFVAINEFNNQEQANHFDMKLLHASLDDYNDFVNKLEIKGQLLDEEVRIKTLKDNEKVVRVSVRSLRDRNHQTIGRIGVVRDVTELRHKVEELTDDIGQVLHTYSSALVDIKLSGDVLVDSMKPDPFEATLDLIPELALTELKEPVKLFVLLLNRLLTLTGSQERETPPLLIEKKDDLIRLKHMFDNYEKEVPLELRPAVLREAMFELITICDEIRGEKLPRELIRQIKTQGQEILRILNLFKLHQMRDLTFTMGHTVRALREFVISGDRVKQIKSTQDISTLIALAIKNIGEFAHSRNVQFRKRIDCPDALVYVVERDMIRALANILHNAIKYSWKRTDNTSSRVMVRAQLVNDRVRIEFENYGVPIPKDEIKELIYELGFRGRLSSDRGRMGTGVGLADALRVLNEHEGTIKVDSHPAIFGRKDDDYNQPFLTTVTLSLPVYHQRGEGVTNEA